ncbi:zonular occludens toxin domain-containing protein [Poseidonibacter lekithochrous]|uniref:zonular occludens toxin domain-containing protein n=1 Tax=Poseidonibacter TaxID=2321187 RepID=UPI001C08BB2B|nr:MULTISPECIES: zonular occludens toxin domain-containing protein [Poseidonibacter]MBU3014757.1 zonular occludens toxin domain-containing protein [Poseidonibacter lekithochrous]MDO6828055.1 zonular occludens toxin domain-containing protein [Poseidonibacter sp. 1_MG-2023]
MAIKYYVGVPRSGKTYKAMTVLYYTFVDNSPSFFDRLLIKLKLKKEKEIEFDNAYTNINQFNFDISDKIFPLDFEKLYADLTILYNMYLLKKSDSELIEKSKELKIYRTLFVFDECHNYLKTKDDKVLVWWFTYHAHLHHELILITQDLTLVNNEYKRVAEYFYKAIPSRFRMSKSTFKYIQYSTHSMYAKDKIGTDTVKANKKIFDLYVSGADSNGNSIIHKYILFALLALFLCVFSVYSFLDSIAIEDDKQVNTDKSEPISNTIEEIETTISNPDTSNNKQIFQENLKLFKFDCFKSMCSYRFEDKRILRIPSNILKIYLLDIEADNKFLEIKHNRLYIYVLVNSNRFSFITNLENRGNENEKDSNENSGFIGFNN